MLVFLFGVFVLFCFLERSQFLTDSLPSFLTSTPINQDTCKRIPLSVNKAHWHLDFSRTSHLMASRTMVRAAEEQQVWRFPYVSKQDTNPIPCSSLSLVTEEDDNNSSECKNYRDKRENNFLTPKPWLRQHREQSVMRSRLPVHRERSYLSGGYLQQHSRTEAGRLVSYFM